jgi:hypothetical protein
MIARRTALALLALLLSVWPFLAAAQDATPISASDAPLDLAAMALTAEDVPGGFFDEYAEEWTPAGPFADLVFGGAAPAGLERVYQSFYFNPEQEAGVHNYLFEFASPQDIPAGFAFVDPALRPPLPDGTIVGPTHASGPELGDGPSELTVVTYDTWAEGGPLVDIVAASFRRDRLVAGVTVERYTDPPPAGAPLAEATPAASDIAREELAIQLASRLDERITTVLAGGTPPGIDRTLADITLPLDQLVDVLTPVLGGYKTGIDLLRCGICGEENSLLPFADDALGGFSRTVSVGPLVDGEPTPPFVSVAISTFASHEAAEAVLEAIRQAPNDRPTPGPIPRGSRTLVADPVIPETTAAVAFQAALDAEDPDALADSAGVDFVSGNRLVTVDIQGGLSAKDALAAAVDLARQQATCLAAGGVCGSVTAPTALLAEPAAG